MDCNTILICTEGSEYFVENSKKALYKHLKISDSNITRIPAASKVKLGTEI